MRPIRFLCAVLVLSVAVAVSMPSQASAATYKINVSPRAAPNLPIGKVRATLAGVWAGGTTLSIGDGTNTAAVTFDASGDAFAVLGSGAGADRIIGKQTGSDVTLTITPRSMVGSVAGAAWDGNLCVQAAGAVAKTYALDFTSPSATAATLRLTSYSAASELQDHTCHCATRRVDSGKATWDPGFLNGATIAGRHPLDVIFILDESGSMNSVPPGATSNKWVLTREAVSQFITQLDMESSVAANGSADDRLALVFFDSTSNPILTSGSLRFFPRSNWAMASSEVTSGSHPRGGSTTIGGAVKTALEAAAANANRDAVIVLMSDGMQNTSPMITDGPATLPGKTLNYAPCIQPPGPGACVQPLSQACQPILTIGLGLVPGSVATLLLQAINNETAGSAFSLAPINDDMTANSYENTLISALKGNTLSLAGRRSGTIARSDRTAPSLNVDADGTIKRLIFNLGWSPSQPFALDLAITRPDGTVLNPTLRRPRTGGVTIAADIGGSVGVWKVQPIRVAPPTAASVPALGDTPYHVSVLAVEGSLDFQLRLLGRRHAVGEPLVLRAELALDGKPVTGAGGAMQVQIDGPNGALGNLLRDAKDPGGQREPEPGSSAFERKLSNLMQDKAFLAKALSSPNGKTVSFVEVSNGIYDLTINDTNTPGHYKFHFALDLNGPKGHIGRIEEVETQVEVVPQAAPTQVAVTRTADAVNLIIDPQDARKFVLGPGYESRVLVKLDGPGTVGPVSDPDVSGRYTVTVTGVPASADPRVEISINERVVRRAPLSKLANCNTPVPTTNSGGCASCRGTPGGDSCLQEAGGLFVLFGWRRRTRRQGDRR